MVNNTLSIFIKTDRLSRDDRLRKQINSLKRYYEINLYVLYNDDTAIKEILEDVNVKIITLYTRKIFPKRSFSLLKSIELYLRLRMPLQKSDMTWIHDNTSMILAMLLRCKFLIWDLHELPYSRKSGRLRRFLLKKAEENVDVLLHGNRDRLNYLFHNEVFVNKAKHAVVRNYPDLHYLHLSEGSLPETVINLLGGSAYIYVQGLGSLSRFPYNTVSALLQSTDYMILIVGPLERSAEKNLRDQFGSKFAERVILLGYVDQLHTAVLIKNSMFSVVLYSGKIDNSKFCEPNRLFQALALGVPCIVGKNPPMAELKKYQNVIVLEDYGENLTDLCAACVNMTLNLGEYREHANKSRKNFIWSDKIINEVVK